MPSNLVPSQVQLIETTMVTVVMVVVSSMSECSRTSNAARRVTNDGISGGRADVLRGYSVSKHVFVCDHIHRFFLCVVRRVETILGLRRVAHGSNFIIAAASRKHVLEHFALRGEKRRQNGGTQFSNFVPTKGHAAQ